MSAKLTALRVGVSVIALSGSAFALPAMAQVSTPPSSPGAAATAAPKAVDQLDVVVVTAQRREQRVQDIPVAIVAANAAQLRANGVTNLTDLAQLSSGINVTDGNAYVFPIIRGIGSFIQGSSSFSSVAIYIDGVYEPRTTSTAFELDNIAGVEILKGPQSTLYGRNATGGAININTITSQPGDPASGRVALTYGSYNERRASVFLASGLGHDFAVNFTGLVVDRDGWIKNLASTNLDAKGKGLDGLGENEFQTKLTFRPNSDFHATLGVGYSEYDDTGAGGGRQVNPAGAAAVLGGLNAAYGGVFGSGPFKFATAYGTSYGWSNRRRGSDFNVDLTAVYNVDSVELTSVTGYGKTAVHTSTDALSANVPTIGFDGDQPTQYFSQELRARSSGPGIFNWLAGVNYFIDQSDPNTELLTIFLGSASVNQAAKSKDRAVAPFAEIYIKPIERLTLTAGLRYTDEQVDSTALLDGFGIVPVGTHKVFKDNKLTYRVIADYKTDWGLLYASVSTGFKSGGQNATNLSGPPFGPETITAYETGVKSDLFDRRLRLNASAFYYDFQGIQAALVGGPTGGAQYFVNGKSAVSSGIEGNFEALVARGFNLTGGFTYLIERKYTNFEIPADPVTLLPALNVTGNKLVGAPEFSAVGGVHYTYDLDQAGKLDLNANVSYNSGYFLTVQNDLGTGGFHSAAAVTLVDARITYTPPNKHLTLAFWGRNLFNEKYERGGLSALGGATVLALDGMPQTFGGTITLAF